MATATLTIDLDAIAQNWRALDGKSAPNIETAAVIKADAYGLGADVVAKSLHRAGVKSFFVALAEEGIIIRKSVGNEAKIYVLSGMMLTDAQPIRDYNLIPMLNAPEQVTRFRNETSDLAYGLQLDTGMNRLGLEPDEFMGVKDAANDADLIISHLACADEPTHPQNSAQLAAFHAMTDGVNTRRSLAATGGTLLGADYHFDLCRPGVGLYGGFPFADAKPVAHLAIPVIQTRKVAKGETVGYSATWTAKRDSVVATLAAGYADGLIRAMGHNPVSLFANNTPCPLIGRVSMDLLTVDVTDLDAVPNELHLLNSIQTIEDLANAAGTIGYEILTSLGGRYARRYIGGA